MDPIPSEHTTESEPKEILLDKTVAGALGRGLRQIFAPEKIKLITDNINQLNQPTEIAENAGIEKKWLSSMLESCSKITKLLNNLEKAKEVKLIHPHDSQSGWTFSFSEEEQIPENSQPGEFILDSALTAKVRGAIEHNFQNSLAPISGFSELISVRNKNTSIQGKATIIMETSRLIIADLSKITEEETECQLKLATDTQGNTNMSLIPQ